MLKMTNYQGNANQNHDELSPYTCQNDFSSKKQEIVSVDEDVEKREHLYTVEWECKLVQPLSKTV